MKNLKKITIILFIILLPVLISGFSFKFNNEYNKNNFKENKKIKLRDPVSDYHQLRKKLKKTSYKTRHEYGYTAFCNQFLDNFINNKNIEIIKPTIQTNNYNHKKFNSYFRSCPSFKKELTTLYREKGVPVYSHYDYRFYDIDFDNNSENEVRNIFFSAGFYLPKASDVKRNSDFNDFYYVVDLENCKKYFTTGTNNLYDSNTFRSNKDIYNGLIKYKGKYFIYHTRASLYTLYLEEWWPNKTYKQGQSIHAYCSYNKEKK